MYVNVCMLENRGYIIVKPLVSRCHGNLKKFQFRRGCHMTCGRLQNVVLVHIVHISVETVATCQFLLVSSACQQTFNCIKCLIIHSLFQSLFKLVHQYDHLTLGSLVFLHTLYTCTLLVLHILSHPVLLDSGTACTCASVFFPIASNLRMCFTLPMKLK